MVGQIQQSAAVSLRSRMAQAREQVALAQQRQRLPRQDQHPREPRPDLAPRPHSTADRSRSTAQLPPALPLTSEEADLFERLSPLLAKPPRRSAAPQHRVDTVTTERFADTLEAAPDPEMIEDAPLDPPRRLPLADFQADRAAEAPRTITHTETSQKHDASCWNDETVDKLVSSTPIVINRQQIAVTRNKLSNVPASTHSFCKMVAVNVCASRYFRLRSVISSSPRSDGFNSRIMEKQSLSYK